MGEGQIVEGERGAGRPWRQGYRVRGRGWTVRNAKSVEEAVYGELQACRHGVRHSERKVSQGTGKTTAGFRLFAKRGVRNADELHRKERCALHLTLRHLPTLRGFPAQERIALQLEGEIPWETTPSVAATTAQKLRNVTWGFGIDIYPSLSHGI